MPTIVLGAYLSARDFEQHSVWANYESPDDFEEICKWGQRGESIVQEIKGCGYSDEYFFPVLQTEPLPSFRCLKLRAKLTSADGIGFSGYVIEPTGVYCVGVFHKDRSFLFNLNLPDMAEQQLAELRQLSGLELKPFFPLRYTTSFRDNEGRRIEGTFDFGNTGTD